ncbi:MAG: DNA recombination protein RmuC [Chlorobi bacterium]|nr:DNA recombination protein RmuC [Chlorobiota bacterium]
METLYLIAGLVAGAIIGYFVGRFGFKTRLSEVRSELQQQNAVLQTKLDELKKEHEKLEEKYNEESGGRHEAELRVATLKTDYDNLREKLETERKQLEELQKRFQTEFENIANKILKQNTLEFSQASAKNMSDLLNPLKEKITSFEKKVEETYEKGLKDQTDIKAELKKLYELSMALDKDAKDLTNALKADTKKQGNWGEIILERVLERSGLIKNEEYILQYSAKSDDGATLRPDVVIRLPEEKHLVVDSKVSLTAYTEYSSAETDQERDIALKRHLDSIKKHVNELSEKDYSKLLGINSPDFVLMFMPIEPAFGLAVQTDHELFNYAWRRKVVIVSPTTLLATLRTIASIWKYEKQSQNAQEIARRGGLLYDKFVSFVKDLEAVGTSLERAEKAYDEAHKKLTSGRGDLISQAEQLKSMGVITKKSLPSEYLEGSE